jgi:hypothetical protein
MAREGPILKPGPYREQLVQDELLLLLDGRPQSRLEGKRVIDVEEGTTLYEIVG